MANFTLETILDFINKKHSQHPLPKEVKDVYDEEKYKESLRYGKEKYRFNLLVSLFSFVTILIVFSTGILGVYDDFVRSYLENKLVVSLVFFGGLGFLSVLFSMPFSYYSTFVIEQKFGFNRSTRKTFFLDQLKSILLGAIIGSLVLSAIIYIYQQNPSMFWLYAWLVSAGFMIFMSMFYSHLIVPIFNKQKPLEEGELRDSIQQFAQKIGFNISNIYVIDGSKRSTKANAYFTGFGKTKRIVLYDSLIEKHSTEELVAVLAHEMGHYKLKHTIQSLIIGLAQSLVIFYLLSLFISPDSEIYEAIASAFGGQPSFHLGIIGFGILYTPIGLINSLVMNYISRKNEYAADHFAAVNYQAIHLATALKKLSKDTLSNLMPHPAYVLFHYSHPTLYQRISALGVG